MTFLKWAPEVALAAAAAGAEDGARELGQDVLERADEHVPFLTGELRGTGRVSSDGAEAAVSYDTVYAARLHEHPEYNFQGQGRGRWLMEAADETPASGALVRAAAAIARHFR